jgi:hypothetical protein
MTYTINGKIPKLKIDMIGVFDDEGKPINWKFDGSSHPYSVGVYIDLVNGIELYGGYTIEELKEIYLNN